MSLANEVKSYAFKEGASLIGIASVDRFEGAPRGHHPKDFMSEAESVISIGIRLLESIVNWDRLLLNSEIITPQLRKEVLQDHFYARCGYEVINSKLEEIALAVALFLEEKGYPSLYFPATYGSHHREIQLKVPGYFAPFSHRHAAVRAGLGEFGLNNLVLTPQYGPRIRFISIITTAELEANPLVAEKICLGEKCSLCIENCKAQALIPLDNTDAAEIFFNSPSITKKEECHLKRREVYCAGKCIQACPIGRR